MSRLKIIEENSTSIEKRFYMHELISNDKLSNIKGGTCICHVKFKGTIQIGCIFKGCNRKIKYIEQPIDGPEMFDPDQDEIKHIDSSVL